MTRLTEERFQEIRRRNRHDGQVRQSLNRPTLDRMEDITELLNHITAQEGFARPCGEAILKELGVTQSLSAGDVSPAKAFALDIEHHFNNRIEKLEAVKEAAEEFVLRVDACNGNTKLSMIREAGSYSDMKDALEVMEDK